MNGEYIRAMSDAELTERLQLFLVDHPAKNRLAPLIPLVKERIKKLSDFIPLTNFLFQKPEYDIAPFHKLKIPNLPTALEQLQLSLKSLNSPWSADSFEQTFRRLAQQLGIGAKEMFQLIRLSISGQLVTPPLFETIQYLGEAETLKRVEHVVNNYPDFIYSDQV